MVLSTTKDEDALKARIQQLWTTVDVSGPGSPLEASEALYAMYIASGRKAEAYSMHSSNLYAAAGTYRALAAKSGLVRKVAYLAKAACLLFRARRLSDRLEETVGMAEMTPAQLDVRATILRRTNSFSKAKELLCAARSRSGITTETAVLVTLGIIECCDAEKDFAQAERELGQLERGALLGSVKIETLVRSYRAFGRHFAATFKWAEACKYADMALDLAQRHSLGNQIAKVLAERDGYKKKASF